MDWYATVFELIDMRSFSNLWYWIALSVVWSSASHWVMGVPFDMIQRAQRHGGQAETDMRDMVRININRLLYISGVAGMWILGAACCALTMLGGLGFFYQVEFCQAVFLLIFPLSLVALLSVRTAHKLVRDDPVTDLMIRILNRHRFYTQAIGMASIFVTAIWGMRQNLAIGVLGS